jgi:hypothetical protein
MQVCDFTWGVKKRLWQKTQASQIGLSPACALKDLSDGLRPEGLAEVVIHKQHSTSIEVLIDVVGAPGFSAPEAFILDGSDPFPSGAVP